MVTRTYLSKFNSIIQESDVNTGINPIAELVYGTSVTRLLVYFDHNKIKKMVEDKTFADVTKLRHYLKITNAGSIDFTQIHCGEMSNISDKNKIRAASFDLIFFLIPQLWDGGKGFEYVQNFFNQGYYGRRCKGIQQDSSKLISKDGCNWYQARNGYKWQEEGVYSNDTLSNEYNNFSSTDGSSVVIGRQHFDIGNENINLDITCVVNKFISGELENYGIGIAFAPELERKEDEVENYIGFMTHKTNTFFEPYVETHYDETISDDRSNFALDKDNKLYLYCNIGSQLVNLDEIPTCEVDGKEYEVKQATKGVYYIDINLSRNEYRSGTMLYDTWDNLIYQGTKLEPVELDFVIKNQNIFFNVGNSIGENTKFTPSCYGIDNAEKIKRGDIRKLVINAKMNYTKNTSALVDEIEARLYIKDGTREVDVFPYEKVNKSFSENFIVIDTNDLIPQRYYIDVKFKYNLEEIMHHNVLTFDIVDDLNNKYN